MKEKVFEIHNYGVGHRVNKQLLVSLEEIFKQHDTEVRLQISAKCNNKAVYIFDNICECFEYFEKNPYRIIRMEIEAAFGESYARNKITLKYDNDNKDPMEVWFQFDNSDDYLVLKNKIELCLKNFKTHYTLLAVFPIMPLVLTGIFLAICVYTGVNDIVYPKAVRNIITFTWIFGSMLLLLPPFKTVKRNIFPCTEFWIGQNEIIEEKGKKIRQVIATVLLSGIALGFIVELVNKFLFKILNI